MTSASSAIAVEVADRCELREAERVELVAGEQRQVGVGDLQDLRLAVVQQAALEHGDDRELDHRAIVGDARPGGGQRDGIEPVGAGVGGRRRVHDVGERAAAGADGLAQARDRILVAHRSMSANAAAAAAIVKSICSGVWAREGNHASNCDAGA